jgi:hypothetical protein
MTPASNNGDVKVNITKVICANRAGFSSVGMGTSPVINIDTSS